MFAHSIKKLELLSCNVTQTLLDAIGILPNLQILKFNYVGFKNLTWEPSEGGFSHLQYLKFANLDLKYLLATEDHFPVLRDLVFYNCRYISEIPDDIGGIDTLEIIEVDECKTALFESARRIVEEQSQFGNTLLQLRLGHSVEQDIEGEEDKIKARVVNNALVLWRYNFRRTTILPQSIKSLKLSHCALTQISLHAIGVLPELEFLKFDYCVFESSTWEPSEGEFRKLQTLKISGDNLQNWIATEINFPVLRRFVLKHCHGLDDIPDSIGRIETLESLELDKCYPDLFDSASRILEKQRLLGNALLQLRLRSVIDYENDKEESEEEED